MSFDRFPWKSVFFYSNHDVFSIFSNELFTEMATSVKKEFRIGKSISDSCKSRFIM